MSRQSVSSSEPQPSGSAKRMKGDFILYKDQARTSPQMVFHSVVQLMHRLLLEGDSTPMNMMILEARSLFDWDLNTVDSLKKPTLMEKEKCIAFFNKVEVENETY